MTQLAFDFDELIDEARLEEFAGLDVVERNGKQYHVRVVGKDVVYTPVGYKPSMLACGLHEDTVSGRDDCVRECLDFTCPLCGERQPGEFVYRINHGFWDNSVRDCTARGLKINHTWARYRNLLQHEDPEAEPVVFTNCWVQAHGHKDSYKRGGWPIECLIASLIEDYERCIRMRVDSERLPPIDLQKLRQQRKTS